MTTTKCTEKERKLRRHLRIKEVRGKDGSIRFYPQKKWFGIWWDFDNPDLFLFDYLFKDWSKSYNSLNNAKDFIDRYVNSRLSKKKIIYHDVNYLTS